jgi:hypothetical protein
MADTNNRQSNTSNVNPSDGPLGSLSGSEFNYQQFGKAIYDAFSRSFKDGRFDQAVSPVKKSQSSYSDNSAKWETSRNKAEEERRRKQKDYRRTGNILDDFETGIKDQLLDSLAGGSFKKSMQNALTTFSKEFGVDIQDLPHELGKEMGKKAFTAIRNSNMGANLQKKLGNIGQDFLKSFDVNDPNQLAAKQGLQKVMSSFAGNGEAAAGAQVAQTGLAQVGEEAAVTGDAVAGLASNLGGLITTLGPQILLIVATLELLKPAIEGFMGLLKSLGGAFNRDEEMREKRNKNAQERLKKDVEWLATQPFKILEQAAEEWASTWDATLRNIAQTQGYEKEDVYTLYSNIAERLRSEGLDSAIAATDIVSKLSSILDTGLSGRVAEEFAYEAAKLTAAMPTEDFTSYAATYSQLASNAIAAGASQQEAIDYANSQLEQFASNVLYASRQLTGGFSTGLRNAESLFTSAVEIAQTARSGNAAEISGTLTAVSGIIGAVAPDLASGLVDAVVQAAIGGNSDTIVALRSLAGVNAGNTEFLRQLATNPQAIFTQLFTNLAQMQNMSPDNYMEVAEGLASVFGLDMKAFARVDFNQLATNIAAMNVNSATLEENLELLASGQSTTSAEQLKMQQINQQILDEGLAYVIDSEAGRMIQQHMWDEQIANELANTEYSVSIHGAVLEFMEGIYKVVKKVIKLLNPLAALKGLANIGETAAEADAYDADLTSILEIGAVGANSQALDNLLRTGEDLQLMPELVEMMGGHSRVASVQSAFRAYDTAAWLNHSMWGGNRGGAAALIAAAAEGPNSINSSYTWGSVSKRTAQSIQSSMMNTTSLGPVLNAAATAASSATAAANEENKSRMQAFMDTVQEAAKTKSYEEWVATAKTFGIADYAAALEAYGTTEDAMKDLFSEAETQEGAKQEDERKKDEKKFRDQSRQFWDYENGKNGNYYQVTWAPLWVFMETFQKELHKDHETIYTKLDTIITLIKYVGSALGTALFGGFKSSELLGIDKSTGAPIFGSNDYKVNTISTIGTDVHAIADDIKILIKTFTDKSDFQAYLHVFTEGDRFKKCLNDWVRYIADSKSYTADVSKANAWSELKLAEGENQTNAILALANAMQVFSADELKKLDPQLQSNVLLGQIVVILQAMMQQNNNNASGFIIPDSLSAMALGSTRPAG